MALAVSSTRALVRRTGGVARLLSTAAAYERDGFVIKRQVVDAGLVDEMRDHVEWVMNKVRGSTFLSFALSRTFHLVQTSSAIHLVPYIY